MTTEPTTTEPTTTEPTEPASTPDAPDDPGTDGGDREAAKYRRRLRETEAERDTLTASVDSLRRQLVDNLAAPALVDPGDLWRLGVDLADLLADDGAVDVDKVNGAIEAVLAERPHLAAPRAPRADLGQGARGKPIGADPWTSAFKS